MKSSDPGWSIGEVAERLGMETHVLRHWEDMGLLQPARDPAGRRRYRRDDVVRIATVIRNKAAGLSLEQIRVLLDTDTYGRHRLLAEHLADLERRMADMERARAMTRHAFECEAHDIARCPSFAAHVQDMVDVFERGVVG